MKSFVGVEMVVRMFVYMTVMFFISLFTELSLASEIIMWLGGTIWSINPILDRLHELKQEKKNGRRK